MKDNIEKALEKAREAEKSLNINLAIGILKSVCEEPDCPVDVWFRLGMLYQELGRKDEAISYLSHALEVNPTHVQSLEALYEMCHTTEQELAIFNKHLDSAKQHGLQESDIRLILASHAHRISDKPIQDYDTNQKDFEIIPDEADMARFSVLFGGREDVYARQWFNPAKDTTGYVPVHEPLTPGILLQHFVGAVTLGIYVLRTDGTCLFFVLDLDILKEILNAARLDRNFAVKLSDALQESTKKIWRFLLEIGFSPIVEDSGYKGRHFWVPLEQAMPAGKLFDLGRLLVPKVKEHMSAGLFDIEFFPKQFEQKGKGLGNLVKLPLGIHRRSGKRSTLLDEQLKPIARPFSYLRSVPRAKVENVLKAIEVLSSTVQVIEMQGLTKVDETKTSATVEPPQKVEVLPAPPPVEATWTESDFEHDSDVSYILSSCVVLNELVKKAVENHSLEREELLILRHTLGYFPSGLLAFNYIHNLVKAPEAEKLKSILKGNSISCSNIRSKAPKVISKVKCRCEFGWAKDTYPSPILHLKNPSRKQDDRSFIKSEDIETQIRRLANIKRRIIALEQEGQKLAKWIAIQLKMKPEMKVDLPEGCLALVEKDGIETLEWTPAQSEANKDNLMLDKAGNENQSIPRFEIRRVPLSLEPAKEASQITENRKK